MCGGSQAAKAAGCNPAIREFESLPSLLDKVDMKTYSAAEVEGSRNWAKSKGFEEVHAKFDGSEFDY